MSLKGKKSKLLIQMFIYKTTLLTLFLYAHYFYLINEYVTSTLLFIFGIITLNMYEEFILSIGKKYSLSFVKSKTSKVFNKTK